MKSVPFQHFYIIKDSTTVQLVVHYCSRNLHLNWNLIWLCSLFHYVYTLLSAIWNIRSKIDQQTTDEVELTRKKKMLYVCKIAMYLHFGKIVMTTIVIQSLQRNIRIAIAIVMELTLVGIMLLPYQKRMYFCHKFSIFIKMLANTFEKCWADIEATTSSSSSNSSSSSTTHNLNVWMPPIWTEN